MVSKRTLILILGVLGILDTLILITFTSVNVGTTLPGIIGLLLVLNVLDKAYNTNYFVIKSPLIKKVALSFFILWLVSFVIIEGLILISSQNLDNSKTADYLLILGAGLKGDQVSLTLASRMKVGINYLKKYRETKVIVSGGKGIGEKISEAEAMRRYLLQNGINKERIIKEERSTSTMENFQFSKEIISDNDTKNEIMIITSEFHIFRAKMLARRVGLTPYALPSKTPYYLLPNVYLREYFAVIKSFVFDR